MLGAKCGLENEFRGGLRKSGECNRITEDIVHPAQLGGRWSNREAGIQQAQIMAVPGTAHQPMLAERHRLVVAVLGAMFDAKYAQWNPEGMLSWREYAGAGLTDSAAKCRGSAPPRSSPRPSTVP